MSVLVQLISLHAQVVSELWKPYLLRLLCHQCLLYEVDVPPSAMDPARTGIFDVSGASSHLVYSDADEPAFVLGLSNSGKLHFHCFDGM